MEKDMQEINGGFEVTEIEFTKATTSPTVTRENGGCAIQEERSCKSSFIRGKLCLPKTSQYFSFISFLLLMIILWASLHILLVRHDIPSRDVFMTLGLVLTSYLTGEFFKRIYLPNVVGMYIIGAIFRTLGFFGPIDALRPYFITARYIAVSVVLTKSGLGLNLKMFRKYPFSIMKLSFLPCTAEAIAVAILSKLILPQQFPWIWAFLFGFAICAVSPTLGAQNLSTLRLKQLYVNEKMTGILAFTAAIDDIYSISIFAVIMSTIIQTEGYIAFRVLIALLQLLLGLLVGLSWGFLSACFPHKDNTNVVLKQCLMLFLGGISMYFGAKYIGTPAGGPLGCFAAGAMANEFWNQLGLNQDNKTIQVISNLWSWIMEPLLFSLVGVEVNLQEVEKSDVIFALLIILFGVSARILTCVLCIYGNSFKRKEKAFLVLANLPKATVQAALGPQALDLFWLTDKHLMSMNILQTSVFTVVLITTISSIILKLCTKRLLITKRRSVENKC